LRWQNLVDKVRGGCDLLVCALGNFITAEMVNQHHNSVNEELANGRLFGTASQGDTLTLERGMKIIEEFISI